MMTESRSIPPQGKSDSVVEHIDYERIVECSAGHFWTLPLRNSIFMVVVPLPGMVAWLK
jgi:hypothetical protein